MEWTPQLRTPAFPIVVSGPSGAGKTVLCAKVSTALPWTALSVSATTRPPRDGERDGESYCFHSAETFEAERRAGRLVEWAEVHGHFYGTPRARLDQKLREGFSVVLNIDVQGGLHLRKAYPESLLVFVLPPSLAVLEQRLIRRGADSREEIERRLRRAAEEIEMLPQYDSVIVNEVLEDAASELISVVRAERTRVSRRLPAPGSAGAIPQGPSSGAPPREG